MGVDITAMPEGNARAGVFVQCRDDLMKSMRFKEVVVIEPVEVLMVVFEDCCAKINRRGKGARVGQNRYFVLVGQFFEPLVLGGANDHKIDQCRLVFDRVNGLGEVFRAPSKGCNDQQDSCRA